jgi:hypothetical protein
MMNEDQIRRALDHLQTLIHDPWAKDEDIEHTFLQLMAEDLLNLAYEQYRQRGRGTLLFDLRGGLGWRSGSMPPLYYLTYPDLVEAGNPSESAREEIEKYNPDHEIPVIFVYDYGGSGQVISKGWDLRAPRTA